jgi:antitoxin component of MazEF toxin-antitoxin module
MALETKRKIFKMDGSYVLVLPKSWIEMHGLQNKKEVKMIIEPNKITIMP